MKKIKIMATIAVAGILLSGCSQTGQSSASKDTSKTSVPSPSVPSVSQAQFDAALKSSKVQTDEFTTERSISVQNYKTVRFSAEKAKIALLFGIHKLTEQSEWQYQFDGLYEADEWMFHNTIELKSSADSFSLTIDSTQRDDQVVNGGVWELSTVVLDNQQISNLCSTLSGTEVRVRFRGDSGVVKSVTSDLSDADLAVMRNSCVIWNGLAQGLTNPKLK